MVALVADGARVPTPAADGAAAAVMRAADDAHDALRASARPLRGTTGLLGLAFLLGRMLGRSGASASVVQAVMGAVELGRVAGERGR